MEFDTFPFDVHVCNFKVHSLDDPETQLMFEYEANTTGVAWKTQTILEQHVFILQNLQQILRSAYH